MTYRTFRFSLLAAAIAASSNAMAQIVPPAAATPEACLSIATDATRLACYDAALSRTPTDTRTADAVAEQAKEQARTDQQALVPADDAPLAERTRHKLGSLFHDSDVYDAAVANSGKGSLLDSRWELAKDSKLGLFQLRAYKPVYVLPVFWTSDSNKAPQSPNPANTVTTPEELDSLEAKFQLSFKTKIAENLFGDNGDIWAAYTQSSRWQVYNSELSRPFRETNYEPEVMVVFRNNYGIAGWRGRMMGISLNHQSNGRGDPLSRSWNRAIVSVGLDRENWALTLRPWYRFEENASDDNNSDIEDYMGRGDATLTYSKNGHEFTVMGRHSLRGGDKSHGAVQLDWGFPINRQLRGHVQVFDGYGESLIDYNHKAAYVGMGISLLEWF